MAAGHFSLDFKQPFRPVLFQDFFNFHCIAKLPPLEGSMCHAFNLLVRPEKSMSARSLFYDGGKRNRAARVHELLGAGAVPGSGPERNRRPHGLDGGEAEDMARGLFDDALYKSTDGE